MSRASARDRIAVVVLGFILLAGVGLTAGWFWLRSGVPALRGSETLPGLEEPVVVYLDRFGIPHAWAEDEADVLRAQGFLHASERSWQMDLLRRTAQGRLSELFGEVALDADRLARALDLWGAARRAVEALPAPERRLLEAYVEGVNEALRRRSGPPPLEFLLLRARQEPWEPEASVAIGKLMALDLSQPWAAELGRFVAADLLPPEKLRYLRLPYPNWGPTVVGGRLPSPPNRETIPDPEEAISEPEEAVASSAPRLLLGAKRMAERWDPLEVLSAVALASSNSWAVAGVRAWAGYPLLANDMHLSLRAPSTWYLNGLHASTDGLHVAGLSVPGVPGVVVGYNREIAWSFTNGMVDDTDFAVEVVNLDGSAYRHGDRWVEFAVRPETIQVRGRRDPEVQLVRSTIRGPVVSDVLEGLAVPLSLLWTGSRTTTELVGLLEMNRATTPERFEYGVRRFESPHQNVIYAAAVGTIGYRLSGTVPLRDYDAAVPVPFQDVEEGWTRFLRPDSFPARRDPPDGFLASANNLQDRAVFGWLGSDYPLPFRARRIVDRLEGELAWTPELMGRLQLDTRSLLADRVLARAVAAADRIGADTAADRLAGWDRRVSMDAAEATLFHAWFYRLRELMAADEFEGVERWAYFPDEAVLRHLEDGGGPWVDDVRTDTLETLQGLEELAMRDALAVWDGREWGEVHEERSVHPLGHRAWLNRLFGFHVGPYPARGGPYTVRPDDPRLWWALEDAWRPPYLGEYGPSQRFVAEMRPGRSLGRFLLPTGQSGHPFSPHYRDMAERWEPSRLIPVPLTLEESRSRAERTLHLVPE